VVVQQDGVLAQGPRLCGRRMFERAQSDLWVEIVRHMSWDYWTCELEHSDQIHRARVRILALGV
jgi:hypothetical protein